MNIYLTIYIYIYIYGASSGLSPRSYVPSSRPLNKSRVPICFFSTWGKQAVSERSTRDGTQRWGRTSLPLLQALKEFPLGGASSAVKAWSAESTVSPIKPLPKPPERHSRNTFTMQSSKKRRAWLDNDPKRHKRPKRQQQYQTKKGNKTARTVDQSLYWVLPGGRVTGYPSRCRR